MNLAIILSLILLPAPANLPDLVVHSLRYDQYGRYVRLMGVVENIGTVPTMTPLLRAPGMVRPLAVGLRQLPLPWIATGLPALIRPQQKVPFWIVFIPAPTARVFYIWVKVDTYDAVQERNEANNLARMQICYWRGR